MENEIDKIKTYQKFIDKELMGTSDRIMDFALDMEIDYDTGAKMFVDSVERLHYSTSRAYAELKE